MKPSRISARKRRVLAVDPAHDAEIDGDDGAVGVDEQVARVHVGVEEAVAERLVEEGSASPCAASRLQVVPGRVDRARDRSMRDAVDPFDGQHAARRCGSQSTAGTRKSGSSLVFSASSDAAAASRRRSISHRDRRATWC